jgi:uncharacterized membrane protein
VKVTMIEKLFLAAILVLLGVGVAILALSGGTDYAKSCNDVGGVVIIGKVNTYCIDKSVIIEVK